LDYAVSFAANLRRNEVVALIGELGSGKTQFVKGVCQYFQVHSVVSSPTFVMLHRYQGRGENGDELLVFHFDLYRIKSSSEMLELGYEEFFHSDGICLIEWADKLHQLTPHDRTEIKFSYGSGENERLIEVRRFPKRDRLAASNLEDTSKAVDEHLGH